MISPELINILVCPETRLPLSLADSALVATLNEAIAKGAVVNRAGQPITTPLAAALLRKDRQVAYQIVDEIPMLLIDESIELGQLAPK